MSDEKEWEYWNKLESFRLYEGVFLQQGTLPPKDMDILSYEARQDWYHNIVTMADFEAEFRQVLSSLRKDNTVGSEFRACSENKKAAFHYVPKSIFLDHWKNCGFPLNKKMKTRGRGRPAQIDTNRLQQIAEKCAHKSDDYKTFVKLSYPEFGCTAKTIKNNFPEGRYAALLKSSRK